MRYQRLQFLFVRLLKGNDGYLIRKGDYRIIYDIHDYILAINVIVNCKDIYEYASKFESIFPTSQ